MSKSDILRTISENATLYAFKMDTIKIYSGTVYLTKYFPIFHLDSQDLTWRCSMEPNRIENRVFWLPNRDDKLAINLIKDYFRQTIEEKQDQIFRLQKDRSSILSELAKISPPIIE